MDHDKDKEDMLLLHLQTLPSRASSTRVPGRRRIEVYSECRCRIVFLYNKQSAWVEIPSMEVAHIMCWEIVIHSSEESFAHFMGEDSKNVTNTFAASCLTVACKFLQKTDNIKLQSLRRGIPNQNMTHMEMAIMNAFDWCIAYTTVPTLMGLLHLSGCLENLKSEEMSCLDEIIVSVYHQIDFKDLEKRLKHPAAWAVACWCVLAQKYPTCGMQTELLRTKLNIPEYTPMVEDAVHVLSHA